MKNHLESIFEQPKPIIGMVHLKPLIGSPLFDKEKMPMEKIIEIAVQEAVTMEKAGVDGLQIENIWDYPFSKGEDIGYETCAALTAAAMAVSQSVSIPFGINCHMNGGHAALAAAAASGGKWIRVFEFISAYISYTGLTEGIGGSLARYRKLLDAEDVRFFCDVNVKHGSHFIVSDRSVSELAFDAEEQGADALIITGFETGQPPSAEKILESKKNVSLPILLGSGVKTSNVQELLSCADGAIIGSWFKEQHHWKNPVDFKSVKEFMDEVSVLRARLG